MGLKTVRILFFTLVISTFSTTFGQEAIRITHLRGTRNINGIGVTVTHAGKVDSLDYCGGDTGPYYMGYSYNGSSTGDGSYTFKFSKPVDEVVINLSALSHSGSTYNEQARIYVNDKHYQVPQVGRKNSCGEEQVILTELGDIAPCINCSASGSNGIRIKGPINSITIECLILVGQPMGFVAGVWMKGISRNEETLKNYKAELLVNASAENESLVINGDLSETSITLYDRNNNRMLIDYESITKEKVIIDLKNYPPGQYKLELIKNGEVETQLLTIS